MNKQTHTNIYLLIVRYVFSYQVEIQDDQSVSSIDQETNARQAAFLGQDDACDPETDSGAADDAFTYDDNSNDSAGFQTGSDDQNPASDQGDQQKTRISPDQGAGHDKNSSGGHVSSTQSTVKEEKDEEDMPRRNGATETRLRVNPVRLLLGRQNGRHGAFRTG